MKKYSPLIGFLILAIIIYKINLNNFYQIIEKINYQLLIPAILIAFPLILIKAYRWNYLKKIQGINYKLSDSFLMYGVGTAIGSLTPGRIGEISKISYLKKDGYSIGKSLTSVIMDRLLDIFYLIIFSYLGIIFFFGFFKKTTLIYSFIIFSIILLYFIIKKQFYRQLIKKIFTIIIPLKYQKSWQTNFQDFLDGLIKYKNKNYFYLLFITFIAWLIYYFQIYLFAQSINLYQIPILHLILAITVSGFITLLPLSFLGIGTREITLVTLLSPLVVNIEIIIILSELILLDYIVLGIIGAISWYFKPITLNKIK